MAIAAFSEGQSPSLFSAQWLVFLVPIVLFTWLIFLAAQIVVPSAVYALLIGVVGTSILQLLIGGHVSEEAQRWVIYAYAAVSVAFSLGAIALPIHRLAVAADRRGATRYGTDLLITLGATSFAVVLAWALLTVKSGDVPRAVQYLSPWIPGLAVAPLAAGLVLWTTSADKITAEMRTAGTVLATAGVVILVAAIMAAWPVPAYLFATSLVSFVVLTALALALRIAEAHYLAAASAALAYLTGFHWGAGHLQPYWSSSAAMWAALLSPATGNALGGFVLISAGVAELAVRARRMLDAAVYCHVAILAVAASVLLVTVYGFGVRGDTHQIVWTYAIYAGLGVVVAVRMQAAWAAWVAGALGLAAAWQWVVYRLGAHVAIELPLAAAFLGFATTATVGLAVVQLGRVHAWQVLQPPARGWSRAGSVATVIALLLAARVSTSLDVAPYLFGLAAIWLVESLLSRSRIVFVAFQVVLVGGVLLAIDGYLQMAPWCNSLQDRLVDARSLQAHGIALASLAIGWMAVRWCFRRLATIHARWPYVDRLLVVIASLMLIWLAVYGSVPGMLQELALGQAAEGTWQPVQSAAGVLQQIIPFQRLAVAWPSWILLAALLLKLLLDLRERGRRETLMDLVVVAAAACPLLAGIWQPQVATASAFCWLAAIGLLAITILAWSLAPIVSALHRGGWPLSAWEVGQAADQVFVRSLGLAGLPVIVISAAAVVQLLLGHTLLGPAGDSVFSWVGAPAARAVPILMMAATVAAHAAVRGRQGLALLAGLFFQAGASVAFVMALDKRLPQWLYQDQVDLVQLNAVVAGGFALLWLAWRTGTSRRRARAATGGALVWQLSFAFLLQLLLVVPALAWLFAFPTRAAPISTVAGAGGWASWLLVSAGALWWMQLRRGGVGLGALGVILAGTGVLFSLYAAQWDRGNWLSYHLLQATLLVGGIILSLANLRAAGRIGGRFWPGGPGQAAVRSAAGLSALHPSLAGLAIVQLVVGLRAAVGDPTGPWWSVAGLLGAGLVWAALALARRGQGKVAAAAVCVNLAASVWWIADGAGRWGGPAGPELVVDFFYVNIIALALPAIVWYQITRWAAQLPVGGETAEFHATASSTLGSGPTAVDRTGWEWHRGSALAAVLLLLAVVGLLLLSDADQAGIGPRTVFGPLALCSSLAAVAVCIWDPRARYALVRLYLWGFAACGMLVHAFHLPADMLVWLASVLGAAYCLGCSFLWSRRAAIAAWAAKAAIPTGPEHGRAAAWLVEANCLLSMVVVLFSYWGVLSLQERAMRVSASQAIVAQMIALGLLAQGRAASALRYAALWLGVFGAVALALSGSEPGLATRWLDRAVAVAVALAVTAVLYGLGLTKVVRGESDWTRAAVRMVPALVALLLSAVVVVLGGEAGALIRDGVVPMHAGAIVAFCMALAGLAAAALVAALVPGRDPLSLPDARRSIYVYQAELFLFLIVVHLRLTVPWLFEGFLRQYWPLLIMLLAFAGVGLSEWVRLRRPAILAGPLSNTAAVLPMLPALGHWIAPNQMHYSVVMLAVASLYGVLSVLRRAFWFAVLAGLSANVALWYVLSQTGDLGFFRHPQLWLIPPAICLLVAAHLNRSHLTEGALASLRLLASTIVYTSSTADIFIVGVGQAPWLPLVLAGLSIAGVLLGVLLRVRTFLFLGASFLAVSMLTVVWYAAVDRNQTWLWYVVGIIVGIAILVLFAIFEKKRQTVLQLMEQLKEWEA